MSSNIMTHSRNDVLKNIDEKITAVEIMTVSTEEKPRRDKMRAIGKWRITFGSGEHPPEGHAQGDQDEGHGLHFCGWRQDVEQWL